MLFLLNTSTRYNKLAIGYPNDLSLVYDRQVSACKEGEVQYDSVLVLESHAMVHIPTWTVCL